MQQNAIEGNKGLYRFLQVNGQISIEWSPEKAKTNADAFTPLVSRRDTDREAQRLLGNFVLRQGYIAIVMGMSLLSLLQLLKQQATNSQWDGLLVIEADALYAEKMFLAFAELFKDIPIITPHNQQQIDFFLDFFSAEELLGYRIFSSPAVSKVDAEFYRGAELQVKQGFSSRLSDLFTRLEFEPLWIYNSFAQTAIFTRAKPVSNLFFLCPPEENNISPAAILVSSGPSLRAALPWLKENQNNVFIACVDSSYRILHNSGILPHLIVSLDAQIFTLRHFFGLPLGSENNFPFLYADLVANPKVTRNWQGSLWVGMSTSYNKQNLSGNREVTPGCDFLEDFFQWKKAKIPGDIQSGGSVSTSLFDLLRNMGFHEIYLLGQDSGFTYTEFHCMGTHHSEQWLPTLNRTKTLEDINFKLVQKRHTSELISIQGKPIKADYVMSLYRSWFEQAVSLLSLRLYNLASSGVPIQGVANADFADVPLRAGELQMLLQKIKDISQKKEDAWGSTKSINSFFNFLKTITNLQATTENFSLLTSPQNHFLKTVLSKIGRKHLIKLKRKNENLSAEEKEKLEKLVQNEQKKFLTRLQRISPSNGA